MPNSTYALQIPITMRLAAAEIKVNRPRPGRVASMAKNRNSFSAYIIFVDCHPPQNAVNQSYPMSCIFHVYYTFHNCGFPNSPIHPSVKTNEFERLSGPYFTEIGFNCSKNWSLRIIHMCATRETCSIKIYKVPLVLHSFLNLNIHSFSYLTIDRRNVYHLVPSSISKIGKTNRKTFVLSNPARPGIINSSKTVQVKITKPVNTTHPLTEGWAYQLMDFTSILVEVGYQLDKQTGCCVRKRKLNSYDPIITLSQFLF
jgi:hypothetical protein